MPKVKLLVGRVTGEGAENRGDIVDVSPATADRMIATGQAEMIRAEKPETAVKRGRKAEKAAK